MKKIILIAGLVAFSQAASAHTGLLPTDGFVHGFQHPFLGLDHFLAMLGLGLWASSQSRLLARQAIGLFLFFMIVGALLGLAGFGFAYVETAILVSLLLVGIALNFPIALTLRRYAHLDVGRNKPVRALARTGVSGTPIAGNTHPCCRRAGLFRPTSVPFRHSYQMTVLNRLVYNDERWSVGTINSHATRGNEVSFYGKSIILASIAAFASMHGLAHGSALPVTASAYAYIAGIMSATTILHFSGLALGLIARRINAAGLIHIYGTMTGLIGAWLLLA